MASDRRRLSAVLALGLILVSACVPSSARLGVREPDLSLPEAYRVTATANGEDRTQALREAVLDDPQLVALVDQALAHNRELAQLDQEVRIRNAEVLAASGEYLPRLGIGAGVGVEKVGRFTSQGASDAADELEPGKEIPENLGDLHVAFHAAWEVDVWRKLRNRKKAARLRYLSGVEGRHFVATRIVAEVAELWYDLEALDAKKRVVQTNVELLESSLRAVRLQKESARVTELAVQRFEAELFASRSRSVELDQRIVEVENRLNVLCGRAPQPILRDSSGFEQPPPSPVLPGSPADLLETRPDVRAARLELEAAKLDVKAARAAFYPSLGLDLNTGLEALSPAKLASLPESLFYDVAAGVFAPLLNRRALKASYLAENADQMRAVLAYEQAVLQASGEVSTELARVRNLDRAAALRAQQVERLETAVETSTGLFRSARADYLEVLTTRRDALEAEIELIDTRREQFGARVRLYQTLGGGWTTPVEVPR